MQWPAEAKILEPADLRRRPLYAWIDQVFAAGARQVFWDALLLVATTQTRGPTVLTLLDLTRHYTLETQAEIWLRALRRVGYTV